MSAPICPLGPVTKGSRVTLVAKPGTLGKVAAWKGACKGTYSRCSLA